MKLTSILQTIEETLTAAAFAEADEHRTALEMLRLREAEKKSSQASHARSESQMRPLQSAA